jgi:integrase
MSQKRKNLTYTYLRSRRRASPGQREETMDTEAPRLGFRVTDTGHRSFIYRGRFPGSANPTRRLVGDYPGMTLAKAREIARRWDGLIASGVDPKDETRRLRAEQAAAKKAEVLAEENVFAARADQYVAHCKKHRQVRETKRVFNKELKPVWEDRLIDTITPKDVKALVTRIAERGKPAMARNVLTVCKSFFDWALEHEWVPASPAAAIRPRKLIGAKEPRQHKLTDEEIVAFWNATDRLGYPFGPLYRLLLLTGVRLREAAGARWAEFDLNNRRWAIPEARFKSKCEHLVPITDAVMQILEDLPRFNGGDHLFSTTVGKKPIGDFSGGKARLETLMEEELGKAPAPFVIHDLRRVVRTKLAGLNVSDMVGELILGHGKKGIQRVYDLEQYEPQMRDALELWAGRLRDLTAPPDPSKVRQLRPAVSA